MKRKRTSVSDLNIDILQNVMHFLGKSGDGYANFARVTSVCKEFMELAGEKYILKFVYFDDECIDRSDESFWKIDGLLTKCARAGSETAWFILLKHVEEKLAFSRIKLGALNLAVKDFKEKTRAEKAVCTRSRSRAAALAREIVVLMVHDMEMDSSLISQQIDAMDIGTSALRRRS